MAPGGSGKRKRGDRTWSQDSNHDGQRPSPHRPGNLNLAQHNQGRDQPDGGRGRGNRKASRGGRGNQSQNSPNRPQASPTASKAMSPPESTIQRRPPSPKPTAISRPATPAGSVNTRPTFSPKAERTPYSYDYLNDTVVGSWKASGRQSILATGSQAKTEEDSQTLGNLFQELVRAGLDGRVDPREAGTAVREILGEDSAPGGKESADDIDAPNFDFDARSLFLDTLSILTDADYQSSALQPLVFATNISPILLLQELDSTLLEALGLLRETFGRMLIRHTTNALYRQANYNLLREESEGYSKLITELFTTSNDRPSSEVVEETFERVKAMIGAFDLDVGRVLDVTLDVFAAVLIKQCRFFVKFLRASSWWPKERDYGVPTSHVDADENLPKWALPGNPSWLSNDEDRAELQKLNETRDKLFWERVREVGIRAFFELGRRRVEKDLSGDELPGALDKDDREWVKFTGTLPPKGNRAAAQFLGFKLRFYSSPARDPSDVLPANMIYLAALLIKIGFISLRDLYPHLWPADEAMEAVREEKAKEKMKREQAARPGGGANNALAMAGALVDDTLPLSRAREADNAARATPAKADVDAEKAAAAASTAEKDALPESADQKIQLLKSLLTIGAIPESLYMLGQFPWLMDLLPELPEYLHRILHHCLSKVYEPLQPVHDEEGIKAPKKISDPDQSSVPKGQVRLINPPPRKVLRWALLDKDDEKEYTDYKFYWESWADSIPVCQSIDDVFLLCGSLLNYSGVKIGQDPVLLMKLARIGKYSLTTDTSQANQTRWIDLCKRLIVPALSLTKCNPGAVNEVFDLISIFSRDIRYSMYAEWYSGQTSRLPDIKSAFDQARAETKDVLKRLSKTNIKTMARALAKVAEASPGVVFNVAISQMESYDNLVDVVVECARYFTYLGYDVLTWSLMNALGQKGRSRVQQDGMLTSKWLNALSAFAGKVFKRYSVMNPTPIIQYVTEQLRQANSTDLIVLEEITTSMAGIVSDTTFNDAQAQAMAGGELLQAQTMLQLLDRRHESKSTSRRLIRSLTDSKLAGQLLIAIAQERQTCVFKIPEEDAHLKLLGNLYDEIHRQLTQYLDLLRSNLSVEDFNDLVPEVSRLIGDYGIEPRVAFWINRPSIAQEIAEVDQDLQDAAAEEKKLANSSEEPDKLTDSDVQMTEGVDSSDSNAIKEENDPQQPSVEGEADVKMEGSNAPEGLTTTGPTNLTPTPQVNGETFSWHPVIQRLMDDIKATLPEEMFESLSLPFYVRFWQLSPYDMYIPGKSYEDEIDRQKRKAASISTDRTDMSASGQASKEREKKALQNLQDRLLEENKRHLKAYSQIRSKLQKEKDHWFEGFWGRFEQLNAALIEHCFFPRLLLSPVDAFFCFKMLKFLHTSGAPNFRTLGLYDQIFREQKLTSLMFLCTSKEADNLGRFLNEVLRDLSRWHADKALYEKEAYGPKKDLPGFAKKLSTDKVPSAWLEFEEFRTILFKWHRSLFNAMKNCLTSGEYMHIRNAIIVSRATASTFPVINFMGTGQIDLVTALSENETREDLKLAASSLLGPLRRRTKSHLYPNEFAKLVSPKPLDRGTTANKGEE